MPGETHTGPLPPLRAEEIQIRDRLSAQISVLAGHIGERNLWNYQALVAAAEYIERTFAELGYVPSDEPFESRGRTVRNIIAEKQGDTPDKVDYDRTARMVAGLASAIAELASAADGRD